MARPNVPYDEETARALVVLLQSGVNLMAALKQPGMPSWHVINQWRRVDEWFDFHVRFLGRRKLPQGFASDALLWELHVERKRREKHKLPRRWSEIEAAIRYRESIPTTPDMPVDTVPPLREIDPNDPETCF